MLQGERQSSPSDWPTVEVRVLLERNVPFEYAHFAVHPDLSGYSGWVSGTSRTFRIRPRTKEFELVVRAKGYEWYWETIRLDASTKLREVKVKLSPIKDVELTVLQPNGQPLEGASVHVRVRRMADHWEAGTTSSKGTIKVSESLPPEHTDIVVTHADYLGCVFPLTSSRRVVKMVRGGVCEVSLELAGTITETATQVMLAGLEPEDPRLYDHNTTLQFGWQATSETGRGTLRVPPGTVKLAISTLERTLFVPDVVVRDGQVTRVERNVDSSGKIEATVHGAPVKESEISAVIELLNDDEVVEEIRGAPEGGALRFETVTSNFDMISVSLETRYEFHQQTKRFVFPKSSTDGRIDLGKLDLSSPGSIAVRVRESADRSVVWVLAGKLSSKTDPNSDEYRARKNQQNVGVFRPRRDANTVNFENLSFGNYTVLVERRHKAPLWRQVLLSEEDPSARLRFPDE